MSFGSIQSGRVSHIGNQRSAGKRQVSVDMAREQLRVALQQLQDARQEASMAKMDAMVSSQRLSEIRIDEGMPSQHYRGPELLNSHVFIPNALGSDNANLDFALRNVVYYKEQLASAESQAEQPESPMPEPKPGFYNNKPDNNDNPWNRLSLQF